MRTLPLNVRGSRLPIKSRESQTVTDRLCHMVSHALPESAASSETTHDRKLWDCNNSNLLIALVQQTTRGRKNVELTDE